MIVPSTTVGFEAEWGANLDGLAHRLYEAGLLPEPDPHHYHCDCGTCLDWDLPLRVQNDSSCDGELISAPYQVGTAAQRSRLSQLTMRIEAAAFEVDAEPGIHAGFHVHARHPGMIQDLRIATPDNTRLVAANLLALHPLGRIAQGRHCAQGTMNADNNHWLRRTWRSLYGANDQAVDLALGFADLFDHDPDSEHWDRYSALWEHVVRADRHSLIAWRTRYDTVEYRLWRSTRMAWRMDLWWHLSALLVSPLFCNEIISVVAEHDATDTDLADPAWFLELVQAHAPAIAEPLATQIEYLDNTTVPPSQYARP
jgi:hypothetical protein